MVARTPSPAPRATLTPARRSTPRRSPRVKSLSGIGQSRLWCLFALFFLLYALLGLRLFCLQVLQHQYYMSQADTMRNRSITLPAPRGLLLDRNGTLLVRNEPAANIVVDPNIWFARPNPALHDTPTMLRDRTINALTRLLPDVPVREMVEKGMKSSAERNTKKRLTAPNRVPRLRTIDIALRIPLALGKKIKKEHLLGVGVFPTTKRVATNGDLAAHVLGFTGREGAGLEGLESGLNSSLIGTNGLLTAEFDTRGRIIPGTTSTDRAAQPGRDIVLTLDAGLQSIAQEALSKVFNNRHAEAATAIVLDPKTGDILALANVPGYNVNNHEEAHPQDRINRAVTLAYEPGSTLKIITVAAALEEGKVGMRSQFRCTGSLVVGNRVIHCDKGEIHGNESMTDVIRNSCNIATAQCAFGIGAAKLHLYERRFGFGQKPGSGMPGESPGQLSAPETWSKIKTATVGFGQGISVSPLQLAAAYGAIANDGVYLPPRIVWGARDKNDPVVRPARIEGARRVISAETAKNLRKMLMSVIEGGTGTKAQLNGYSAGGKTGTAQVAERGHYGKKHIASFVGMVPAMHPQFVILVAVTNPQKEFYGGDVAAPVFKEIAEKTLLARRTPRDVVLTRLRLKTNKQKSTETGASKPKKAPTKSNEA